MRRTGIVVNNYDPTYKNRIQVRVMGLHTEQVDDMYIILDDDLPWFSPAPSSGGNSGSYSVPEVGSRVYVDIEGYNAIYYGQVEVKKDVKNMMHQNADQSDRLNVIAYAQENDDGDYMKIYYLPENGLTIDCMGHQIVLTKYDGLRITSSKGGQIELTRDGDINVITANTVNLNCSKLNLTSGSLTEETVDRIVLGSRLQEIFNNHYHFVGSAGGVTTTEPVEYKIQDRDFAKNIFISKGEK